MLLDPCLPVFKKPLSTELNTTPIRHFDSVSVHIEDLSLIELFYWFIFYSSMKYQGYTGGSIDPFIPYKV